MRRSSAVHEDESAPAFRTAPLEVPLVSGRYLLFWIPTSWVVSRSGFLSWRCVEMLWSVLLMVVEKT